MYYPISSIYIAFIGLVGGIIEFFPISSTAHMIIINNWLNIENKYTNIIEIFVQLGSSIGIFLFFYKKFKKMTYIQHGYVLITIFPTILLGFFFTEKSSLFIILSTLCTH